MPQMLQIVINFEDIKQTITAFVNIKLKTVSPKITWVVYF